MEDGFGALSIDYQQRCLPMIYKSLQSWPVICFNIVGIPTSTCTFYSGRKSYLIYIQHGLTVKQASDVWTRKTHHSLGLIMGAGQVNFTRPTEEGVRPDTGLNRLFKILISNKILISKSAYLI
jgi:hypothetical protein